MRSGLMVDDNLSILTCASAEITASSALRNETHPLYPQLSSASTNQPPPPPPPSKKRRNLPGNPDPEAEVIALSPKALLATNRFICEICNKGFQRDQNLQLHRRGHNLPWKLKQRSNKEVRKRVYVCPEPTCVHHHPSRALGDLTGIKKHFCRKHGEKKWKCEKCSKHYAVQSDWKAHSKICGTREYRCDCGTLFSRRDSFITHRAFCDALAHQSAVTSSAMAAMNPLLSPQTHLLNALPVKREEGQLFSITSQVPSWLASQTILMAESSSCNNIPPAPINPSIVSSFSTTATLENHQRNPNPTSATALLQKAGQMGSSGNIGMVGSSSIIPLFASCPGWESTTRAETVVNASFNGHGLASIFDQNKAASGKASPETPLFHHMMSFEEASTFEEALNGILLNRANKDGAGDDGGETRDFLGLRALTRTDQIFNNEINDVDSSSAFGVDHQNSQTTFWRE